MREKLYGLQALRALAASMVIYAHALSTYQNKIMALAPMAGGVNLGAFGVKIFFCISGFIICHSSYLMPAGVVSASVFAWRRAIRIVPLYFAATGLYAAKLALQGNAPTSTDLIASLLFLPHGPAPMHPVLGVGWTLNFEVFFYLAFGVALLVERPARIFLFLSIFAATGLAGWAGLFSSPDGHLLLKAIGFFADIHLVYFILGVSLALGKTRFRHALANIGMAPGFTVAAAASVVFSGLWLSWYWNPGGWLAEAIILACVSMAVTVCIVETPASQYRVSRPVRWLGITGDASYSSYLTHGFVMGPIARLIAVLRIDMSVNLFASAMVLAATGAGIVVYRSFELPILRRFGKPSFLVPIKGTKTN